MKKLFLFIIMAAASLFALFYYFGPSTDYYEPLDLVPSNAIYIVETDEPIDTWEAIAQSPIWQHLRKQPYIASLTANANALDTLIQKNQTLFNLLGSRKVLASAHLYRPGDYDFLFVVDLERAAKLQALGEMIGSLPLPHYSTAQTQVQGFTLTEFKHRQTGETITVAFVHNLLVASYKRNLVEMAIAQRDAGALRRHAKFADLSDRVGNGLFKLYLNHRYLDDFARIYSPQPNEMVNSLSNDLDFTALALDLPSDNLMQLEGYAAPNDSSESYLKALLQSGQGRLGAHKVLPQRTAYYLSLNFDNFADFYARAEAIYSRDTAAWDQYQRNLRTLEKFLKINVKENFVSWIGDEVAMLQTQPLGLGRDNEFAIVLKANDIDRAKEQLAFVSTQVRKRTPVKFIEIDYKGYTINYLSVKGFFRLLLGKLFGKLQKPYFTVLDDYVVFSNHPQTLKSLIDDYTAERTLAESDEFMDFFSQFRGASNLFMYVQTPVLHGTLRPVVSADTWGNLNRNKAYMVCFSHIGLQMNANGEVFDTKMASNFKQNATDDIPITSGLLDSPADSLAQTDSAESTDDEPDEVLIDDLESEKVVEKYPDGTTKREVSVRDGFRHGRYFEYHPNGRIRLRGWYRNDKPDGTWKYYDEQGRETQRRKFKDGQEDLKKLRIEGL